MSNREDLYRKTAATVIAPVTKADSALPGGNCWGLLCGTAGTVNIMEIDGSTIRTAVPLQLGYNMIQCSQVRTGGTAADIWALY